MHLTIDQLKERQLLLFETLSGSRAYGLDLPDSDTDIKGVFYLPKKDFYCSNTIKQVNNPSNDFVYYELGRFVELLLQSNPNILEMLAGEKDCVFLRQPIFEQLKLEWFISKQCQKTFAGYALGQIKKSRRLLEKIQQPAMIKKKTLLEFCYFLDDRKDIPLQTWLTEKGWQSSQLGLVAIKKVKNLYAVFFGNYRGLLTQDASTLQTSEVEATAPMLGYLYFHEEAYHRHCQDFHAYQQWLENRNPQRFAASQAHGKGYDGKNMMHTFRLLEIARGIATTGQIKVRSPNREKLLAIRRGEFSYSTLLAEAEKQMAEIEALFLKSPLPQYPNVEKAQQTLFTIREALYA